MQNFFDGATVNQICQKHGISKGLIYHNFESKEKLYLRCVEKASDEFISYMSQREFGTDFKLYRKAVLDSCSILKKIQVKYNARSI